MILSEKEGEYVILSWKLPKMNVLSAESVQAFAEALEGALGDPSIRGIVITSQNKEFIAGADIQAIQHFMEAGDVKAIYEASWQIQSVFLRLETGGKPVVAAINGAALGGGYELALACHHRIALDDPQIEIGLPETSLGLMPGAGGTQRLPRKVGLMAGLELVLEGKRLRPQEALQSGLIEELVPDRGALIERALAWLRAHPQASNPWHQKDFRLLGPRVQSEMGRNIFSAAIARLREKSYGHYPGLENALRAIYEGLQVPIMQALQIESQYFARTLTTPTARAMVRTLFVERQRLLHLPHRPSHVPPATIGKVAILGAGMMGRAIGYVAASAGYETWIKDTDEAALQSAEKFSNDLLNKAVSRQRLSPSEAEATRRRLHFTLSYDGLAGADLVIEAVFENRTVKAQVYQESRPYLSSKGILASNTSTLPITSLAEASGISDRFIGLHFFSPAERMPLLEIILGKETSSETLAWSLDFAKKIGKVPIVVRDSRGFFTSRVFGTYVREGLRMLKEGIPPALIENLGRQAGMPVGPLALADEVSISLMYSILRQTEADLGYALSDDPVSDIGQLFVEKLGRLGRKAGKGFYEYPSDGTPKRLWSELSAYFPPRAVSPNEYADLKDRFLYVQVAEAFRTYAEGVLLEKADGDVGSILGWGFAPFTGGVFHFVEWTGREKFLSRMSYLSDKYGERFYAPLA
ncbi:MAG: 3-hydroxyacyl-CoA dehydrogenase NAD-binding domain-containing protein [Bacteroidia bacterium]|nr:3-hydroxyacyl-CoA dehydrogenase NAD-binding domain-containing protein [Bacteroidia bacterium]MCX7651330.1 3-hydroxyacyl-CoA dehydrogenase NAD-binding domain-containing protein [Bacteroidia bacterium]MDW8417150.1 3-hydroxyacyl-CoA dehydrogenase NAD-binding domain-containing protein [Bacteroidia bacterium]